MSKFWLALPLAIGLSACGGGSNNTASQLKIVGSSTVYPFTTAIAEAFQKANPGTSVIVESTGTGSGIKLFCEGVGQKFPDMVNASRQMKKSEYDACSAAGAKQVIEVPIGIDGLTLIESNKAAPLKVTLADIYAAVAANPYGKGPNKAQTWKDVNPSLPAIKIRVLGPPPTSGTRDSFAELMLTKGCESDPAMKALKASDEAKHKDLCTKIREDGVFVEAGENDNLLVQKVEADPGTRRRARLQLPRAECRQDPPGRGQWRASQRSDDPGPQLSGCAQALHLREGRACGREAGDQGFPGRICQRLEHRRPARNARTGAVHRSRRAGRERRGDGPDPARRVDAQVSGSAKPNP